MATRNTFNQDQRPSLTHWLEAALVAMPRQGRLLLKGPHELAFGFTDDRKTEKGNQDRVAIAYCLDPAQYGAPWFFAGLCDGVGGAVQGEIAASIAMAEVLSELCETRQVSQGERLKNAIFRAHAAVQHRLRGSATTFSGILVSGRGTFTFGSVGDSRIYAVTQEEILKLSQDDTLEDMLRRQTSLANETQLREALQGLKQQWKDSLGQAIGSDLPLEPRIQTQPHITKRTGCILCTDGVWKTVEPILERVVQASGDRQDLARRLLNLTEVLHATDNATAIVLPEVADILAWLRSQHSSSERGLVHIVLPTESIVAPWSLFDKGTMPMATTRVPDAHQYTRVALDKPKPKSKRKAKTPKSSEIEKDPGVQLTIEEEVRDETADTPGTVPKER